MTKRQELSLINDVRIVTEMLFNLSHHDAYKRHLMQAFRLSIPMYAPRTPLIV